MAILTNKSNYRTYFPKTELGKNVSTQTYFAHDQQGQEVVLKILRPDMPPRIVTQFQNEWDMLQALTHTDISHYVPTPLDFDPEHLIVQSAVQGVPLMTWLETCYQSLNWNDNAGKTIKVSFDAPGYYQQEQDSITIISQVCQVIRVLHEKLQRSHPTLQLKHIFWDESSRQITIINWHGVSDTEANVDDVSQVIRLTNPPHYSHDINRLGIFLYRLTTAKIAQIGDTEGDLRRRAGHDLWHGLTQLCRTIIIKALTAGFGGYAAITEMHEDITWLQTLYEKDGKAFIDEVETLRHADEHDKIAFVVDVATCRQKAGETDTNLADVAILREKFQPNIHGWLTGEDAYKKRLYNEAVEHWQPIAEQTGNLSYWRWLQSALMGKMLAERGKFSPIKTDLESGITALNDEKPSQAFHYFNRLLNSFPHHPLPKPLDSLLAESTVRYYVDMAKHETSLAKSADHYHYAQKQVTKITYWQDIEIALHPKWLARRSDEIAHLAKTESRQHDILDQLTTDFNLARSSMEKQAALKQALLEMPDNQAVIKFALSKIEMYLTDLTPNLVEATDLLKTVLACANPHAIMQTDRISPDKMPVLPEFDRLWLDTDDLHAFQNAVQATDYQQAWQVMNSMLQRSGTLQHYESFIRQVGEPLLRQPDMLYSVELENLVRLIAPCLFASNDSLSVDAWLESMKNQLHHDTERIYRHWVVKADDALTRFNIETYRTYQELIQTHAPKSHYLAQQLSRLELAHQQIQSPSKGFQSVEERLNKAKKLYELAHLTQEVNGDDSEDTSFYRLAVQAMNMVEQILMERPDYVPARNLDKKLKERFSKSIPDSVRYHKQDLVKPVAELPSPESTWWHEFRDVLDNSHLLQKERYAAIDDLLTEIPPPHLIDEQFINLLQNRRTRHFAEFTYLQSAQDVNFSPTIIRMMEADQLYRRIAQQPLNIRQKWRMASSSEKIIRTLQNYANKGTSKEHVRATVERLNIEDPFGKVMESVQEALAISTSLVIYQSSQPTAVIPRRSFWARFGLLVSAVALAVVIMTVLYFNGQLLPTSVESPIEIFADMISERPQDDDIIETTPEQTTEANGNSPLQVMTTSIEITPMFSSPTSSLPESDTALSVDLERTSAAVIESINFPILFDMPDTLTGTVNYIEGINGSIWVDDERAVMGKMDIDSDGIFTWQLTTVGTPLTPGKHTVVAKFIYSNNNTLTSQPIEFDVDVPPKAHAITLVFSTGRNQLPQLRVRPEITGKPVPGPVIDHNAVVELFGKWQGNTADPQSDRKWGYVRLLNTRQFGWIRADQIKLEDGRTLDVAYDNFETNIVSP